MTVYLSQPIPVDRSSIRQAIDERALALMPDLDTTSPGTTYDFFADLFATFHAEQLTTLTQQLEISFRGSAEKVDRIIQRDAVQASATGTLTRTASDAALGTRVVPAGTEFDLSGADGQPVSFQTVNDETFVGTDDELTSVSLLASLGGTGGNGLSVVIGPGQTVAWFDTLVVDGLTSGGEDAESDEEYLNRVADERPGRAFTIVLPDDFDRYLRNQPGVDRALVVNNYNADTSTTAVGHMTAVVIDADGAALSGGTMTELKAEAQEIANTNGTIHVIAPTYTTITVVFVGLAEQGYDVSDVETRAEAAVLTFLAPANWGLPGSGDDRSWQDKRTVYFQDIVTVLNNVAGFERYTSLTVNGGTSDVAMAGPGALPNPASTAAGTVT